MNREEALLSAIAKATGNVETLILGAGGLQIKYTVGAHSYSASVGSRSQVLAVAAQHIAALLEERGAPEDLVKASALRVILGSK